MHTGLRSLIIAALAVSGMFISFARPALADDAHKVSGMTKQVTLVDESRPVKASMGFAGSDTRRIDVKVWYPAKGKGPWPLIIYTHGTFGFASESLHLVDALVKAGYVVAAADYPLTSRDAYTHITFADVSDMGEQVKDIRFLIDALPARPEFAGLIDKDRIGTTGHSLGAVTSYFASFGARTRDPRIKATALIAGGDPVQAALDTPMGVAGAGYSAASVPVLLLSAERDVFSQLVGPHHVMYARLTPPKFEVMVKGGAHVWFLDEIERPEGNKNPDCLYFEKYLPDVPVPYCEERVPLIDPEDQQAIARDAMVSFFDAYLKDDKAALAKLLTLGERHPDATLAAEQ